MIDRYDAPEGLIAVRCFADAEYNSCADCYFYNLEQEECKQKCRNNERNDDEDVIFVTRADFEKMLMQEIERFYGKGKVKRIIFTKANIK